MHGGDDLAGQRRRHRRLAHCDDLDLTLEGRVVDPVVAATPLEGVVQLADAERSGVNRRLASPAAGMTEA